VAVNPLNRRDLIAGAFGNAAPAPFGPAPTAAPPWSDFGSVLASGTFVGDKTLAWRQDGVAALAVTLDVVSARVSTLSTFQSGASNFG
jgi:hypothetical protein